MASTAPKTTTTTNRLITLLGTTRIAVGSISLLGTSPTLQLFQLLPSPSSSSPLGTALLMTRLFGVRDAVLGTLLYTAETPAAVRRALIAGAVVDGIDTLSCVYGFLSGEISGLAADLVGGGAVVFLLWGLWGLKGLGGGQGGKVGGVGSAAAGGVVGK